jgi:hypothetical protein
MKFRTLMVIFNVIEGCTAIRSDDILAALRAVHGMMNDRLNCGVTGRHDLATKRHVTGPWYNLALPGRCTWNLIVSLICLPNEHMLTELLPESWPSTVRNLPSGAEQGGAAQDRPSLCERREWRRRSGGRFLTLPSHATQRGRQAVEDRTVNDGEHSQGCLEICELVACSAPL